MQQAEFTLYAYSFYSRAERVLWLLKELQLDYQVIRLDPSKGDTQTPAFLQLNPQKKLPVLQHKDKICTDSLAIMEYLVSVSKQNTLIPDDADNIYQFRSLIYYLLTEVEAYLWIAEQASRLSFLYTWPEGTYTEAIERVQKSIVHAYSFIGEGSFIVGDCFTLADIYAHHIFTWASKHELAPPSKVKNYLQRLELRASYPDNIKRDV